MTTTLTPNERALAHEMDERDEIIARLTSERDELAAVLKKSFSAINDAYAEVHAEWQGHDTVAAKANARRWDYEKVARAALGRCK